MHKNMFFTHNKSMKKRKKKNKFESKNDPLGSYTSTPNKDFETPVQDADDL